jgi:tRNA(fMet)-specific endonuclease VapC
MNGDVLVDTNIIVAIFARDPRVDRALKGRTVLVPAVAAGELFFGAEKSDRKRENLRKAEEFLAANTVLACDLDTARHFGRLKEHLRKKGTPIPINDLWIAATAVQYGLSLATRDAHFQHIDELVIETC